MLKKVLLFLGVLGLFFSCSNITFGAYGESEVAFSMGKALANEVTETITASDSVTDNSELLVVCQVLRGEVVQTEYSKKTLLKDLHNVQFNLENLMFGNNYFIGLNIYFKGALIFQGLSDSIILNDENSQANIKLNINQHNSKIEYELNGGQFVGRTICPNQYFFNSVAELPQPKQLGAEFLGWYTNSDFTGEPVTELGKKKFLGDVTLYAKWDLVNYNVNYSTGITNRDGVKTVQYGYVLTAEDLPTNLTKDGYKFDGWYNGEKEYVFGKEVLKDLTLTAKWTETTPPGEVTALKGTVGNDLTSFSISWTNPSDPDFSKVIISCSDTSIKDIEVTGQTKGQKGTKNINNLAKNKSYTFTVKTVDTNGNISAGTNIICGTNEKLTPKDNPVTKGNYVYFGEWPQSIKDEAVYIDESQNTKDVHGWICYLGSDNCYYVKASMVPYTPDSGQSAGDGTGSKYLYKETFSDGKTLAKEKDSNGQTIYYYFKLEPIEWKIENSNYEGGKLLVCNKALMTGQFNDAAPNEITPNNIYETSPIRTKIKADFAKAFSNTAFGKLKPNSNCFGDTIFVPADEENNSSPDITDYGYAMGIRWKWIMTRAPFPNDPNPDRIYSDGSASNIAAASKNGIVCPAIIISK